MVFKELNDRFMDPYFSYDLVGERINHHNISHQKDKMYFMHRTMQADLRATTPFSSDLTSRDDVLLALLSLLLVLVIEGIVSIILLRTRKGQVGKFGLSVKHFIELVRDFNIQHFLSGKTQYQKKISSKLVLTGLSVIVLTFGLEVMILFLTTPAYTDVTNKTLSIRIIVPITPKWINMLYQVFASMDRPCNSVTIARVEQGQTNINPCVTSSATGTRIQLFQPAEEVVKVDVVTEIHRYGAEHFVRFGNLSAKYSARVYYSLDDEQLRLMAQQSHSPNEKQQVQVVHWQLMAYLFSFYRRATNDTRMSLERLNSLYFNFTESPGDDIKLLEVDGKGFSVPSRRYTTSLSGIVPQGTMVLRFAHHLFRASSSLVIAEPDETDLFLEKGPDKVHAVVWRERSRVLNWLSLLLVLLISFVALTALRVFLNPAAMADIAAVLVKRAVGADMSRSPVELAKDENPYFRVAENLRSNEEFSLASTEGDTLYRYGAETQDGREWDRMDYFSAEEEESPGQT